MASILSAGTTTSTALNLTADTSGALQLASNNGTTALTINTTQAIGVGSSPSYGTNGQVLTSSGSGAAPTWTTVSAASLATPSFTTTIGVGGATASASGVGITFPATFSNSTNANTLDDYEEGTFTFTATGFTTVQTGTAYYTKIGNQVTLRIPDLAAVSNTTLCTITGLPVELRAGAAYTSYARVYNASTTYNGHLYGGHANTIEVYFDPAESAFTASGVKGITNIVNFSYTLA